MTAHRLKTWPEYFEAIRCGDKNFEVRRNDRDFRAGDRVTLVWYDPVLKLERADTLEFVISYVLPGGQFGIEPGFAVLALALPP